MKKIFPLLILGLCVVPFLTDAQVRPRFKIQPVEVLDNNIVKFRADFDSRGNNPLPEDRPETWFEFGDDRDDLRFETPRRQRAFGSYEVSEGAARFRPDTEYYVRAVMRFEGDTTRSSILSFNPSVSDSGDNATTSDTATETTNSNTAITNNSITTTTGNSNTASSATTTPSNTVGLQQPLQGNPITTTAPEYSFNLLDFFKFGSNNKTEEETESSSSTDAESAVDPWVASDRIEVPESDFANSATNTVGTGEVLVEKGSRKKQSAAASHPSSFLFNTLFLLLFIILLALAIFLYRVITRKKQRITARNAPRPEFRRALDNSPYAQCRADQNHTKRNF